MEKYSLRFKKSVAKDLRNIPKKDIKRILKCVETLCADPRAKACIKLSGQERYRIRQSKYRIIYEIQDAELVIIIIKVAHRSIAYNNS